MVNAPPPPAANKADGPSKKQANGAKKQAAAAAGKEYRNQAWTDSLKRNVSLELDPSPPDPNAQTNDDGFSYVPFKTTAAKRPSSVRGTTPQPTDPAVDDMDPAMYNFTLDRARRSAPAPHDPNLANREAAEMYRQQQHQMMAQRPPSRAGSIQSAYTIYGRHASDGATLRYTPNGAVVQVDGPLFQPIVSNAPVERPPSAWSSSVAWNHDVYPYPAPEPARLPQRAHSRAHSELGPRAGAYSTLPRPEPMRAPLANGHGPPGAYVGEVPASGRGRVVIVNEERPASGGGRKRASGFETEAHASARYVNWPAVLKLSALLVVLSLVVFGLGVARLLLLAKWAMGVEVAYAVLVFVTGLLGVVSERRQHHCALAACYAMSAVSCLLAIPPFIAGLLVTVPETFPEASETAFRSETEPYGIDVLLSVVCAVTALVCAALAALGCSSAGKLLHRAEAANDDGDSFNGSTQMVLKR